MKKTFITLLAVAVLVPGLAFAQATTQQTDTPPSTVPPNQQQINQDRAQIRGDRAQIHGDQSQINGDRSQINSERAIERQDWKTGNKAGAEAAQQEINQDRSQIHQDEHQIHHDRNRSTMTAGKTIMNTSTTTGRESGHDPNR